MYDIRSIWIMYITTKCDSVCLLHEKPNWCYYGFADGTKTSEEVALEGRILREMLEIVERRNSLQAQLEAEKQRCPLTSAKPPHSSNLDLSIALALAIYLSLHFLLTLYQIQNHFPFS